MRQNCPAQLYILLALLATLSLSPCLDHLEVAQLLFLQAGKLHYVEGDAIFPTTLSKMKVDGHKLVFSPEVVSFPIRTLKNS